ncbi:hypothetical protein IMT09_08580 [Burkholderia cepacia]|uniref:hypothetical protein n=1 Tax=Burkholderia TaxID=32008 RepID=UPI000F559DDC|nr:MULTISPECIES: hypothetical protein [Burkholderia]MBE2968155.1 hypothetical protein [Burkholderia cepacia]RQR72581.1 hypothetical protein DIE11_27580 [Burkholderia sp. Bp9012]RQR83948.1 hypothetical protein DIE10_11250 [Burkholderia sp. Bp9011]RQR94160.1 hypothetical protein DIE09_11435 [Burkholderia sp. Bp9010]RQZ45250.1 hypothetical protein DIE17_21215 [Burkholderia sp. Bp9099]
MSEILSEAEQVDVRAVASGDKAQLNTACAAVNRAAPKYGIDACVELQFNSNVLAPVPDLLLRSKYRVAVLE